jgi:hypothetical protein
VGNLIVIGSLQLRILEHQCSSHSSSLLRQEFLSIRTAHCLMMIRLRYEFSHFLLRVIARERSCSHFYRMAYKIIPYLNFSQNCSHHIMVQIYISTKTWRFILSGVHIQYGCSSAVQLPKDNLFLFMSIWQRMSAIICR